MVRHRPPQPARPPIPASLRSVSIFANTEFRALWLAQLLSVAGDQLARVAITVLVYDRTRSPFWTALTYAVTLLPWVVGGLALSGLADRLPRRQVMVACDIARMVLVCVMALVSLTAPPEAGLWILVALLFVVTLLDSPFKSARSAMMPDILTGERYVLGTAVTQTTLQVGMVSGYRAGRARCGLTGSAGRPADRRGHLRGLGGTGLVLGAPSSRCGRPGQPVVPSQLAQIAAGVRLVFGDRVLRTLMLLGWLVAFYVVPMGLAAPYAASFHASLAIPIALDSCSPPGPSVPPSARSCSVARLHRRPGSAGWARWRSPPAACCCSARCSRA